VVNAVALAAVLAAVSAFVPVLQPGDTVPAIPLVDQSGAAFSLERLRGNAVVLSFIYTRCPDPRMCPLVSSKFARLQAALGTAPIRLLEVTLDPGFDTPAVLRRYGAAYGADARRWTLATGAPGAIDDLARRLGVASAWTAPGTLAHTEAAIVLDPQGRIARIVDGNAWTPGELLAAAREAAGAPPAPLARLGLWLTAAVQSCSGGRGGVTALEALLLVAGLTLGIAAALRRALGPARSRRG